MSAYIVHITTAAVSSASSTPIADAVNETFTTMTKNDFNGDGIFDVIVGAPQRGTTNNGTAYLYSGASLAAASTAALSTIGQGSDNEFLGVSAAFAGDVNADGYSDIIIGTSSPATLPGSAYLYYGAATISSTLTTTDANAVLTGTANGDVFGYAVAEIGDFNNDGYGDVAIGATNANSATGTVYLFTGQTLLGTVTASSAYATINGEDANGLFGFAVSGIMPFNSINTPNILVGEPNFGNLGAAFLYSGSAFTTTSTTINARDPLYAMVEIDGNNNDELGYSMSRVGDVTSDGTIDFIIGAPTTYLASAGFGSAYVFAGEDFSLHAALDTVSVAAAQSTITTSTNLSLLGMSVAGIGNITSGDTVPDVVIGAPYTPNIQDIGATYIISGSLIASTANIDVTVPGNTIVSIYDAGNSLLGMAVCGGGYITNDTTPDLLIGAAGLVNVDTSTVESVYLFSGADISDTTTTADAVVTLSRETANDDYGYAVGGAF